MSEKWWIVGMVFIDLSGRKIISKFYGGPDNREMIMHAIRGQEPVISQGALYQLMFSAIFWSLLPLWGGFKTKQLGRGSILAVACILTSIVFPVLNLTPIIFGIGSYLYLVSRATKDASS